MSLQSAAPDLQCVGISKRFGSVNAVSDVSFNIPPGTFFSILGPSGCGKTTLMRMIAGFDSPDQGDIHIKGKSVLSVPPNKRNVKMVFQHLALFPMMNVYDNIAYGLRCKGESRGEIDRKIKDVLERVALPDVAKRDIHQLSGGQKQRIAIARCMVLKPDVLLLDEPLGALDLKLREAMKIELKLLQHQFNTTFVYITHDQSEALVMSDNVAVMNQGRFEQIGTPQELYHQPASAFVAGFVGDSNRWLGKVVEKTATQVRLTSDSGLDIVASLHATAQSGVGDQVSAYVRPEFIKVEVGQSTNQQSSEQHSPSSVNAIHGKIDSLLFNGANSRVLVRDKTNALIEADVTLTGGTGDPRPGDDVRLSWEAEQTNCF